MKPIKVAILSCIHGHAPQYYNVVNDPFFELVAYSTVPGYDKIAARSNFPNVPRYDTDEELYAAHPEIEAVVIGSENGNHYKQMKEAIRRGLHILSMKVPTMNLEEYREIVRLAKEAKVVTLVEMELRWHAESMRACELIQSGAIGELQSINIVNYSHNPVWWCPWQCNPELSYGERVPLRPNDDRFRGGALTDHAHPFDLVRMMTGADFETVFANVTPNIREGLETEDMIRVIGKMTNGVNFSIDPSYANQEEHVTDLTDNVYLWRKYPKIVEVYLTAVGTKGVIISDLFSKNTYMQLGEDGRYICAMGERSDLWSVIMMEFYQCIREGKTPSVDLEKHYNSIQAMVAAYDSVSVGAPVHI